MGLSHAHHHAAPAATTLEPLPQATLDGIRQFDTCTVANAIEHFRVRLRNEGFTRPGLRCVTGGSPRLLGYGATCRVIDLCQSREFSLERLLEAVQNKQ
jgi:hypothetical protein